MDSEPDSLPPEPPRSIPPSPPPAAMLKPNVPHVPLTPMMDFMARRLEALEKDLALERERAQAAQNMLQQQDSLKGQVEQQLKEMSDSLRREKAERESEETKQHARGRIDALEKRLDEMHQSWVGLLRDAIAQRDDAAKADAAAQRAAIETHVLAQREAMEKEAAAQREIMQKESIAQREALAAQSASAVSQELLAKQQASLKQELGALQGAIDGLVEQLGQWRSETRPLADAAPAMRALEGQVGQRLDHMLAEFRDRISAWERRQALEAEKNEERLQNFAREKASLQRELEERDHQIRQDSIKEKLNREAQFGEQVVELAKRLDALREETQKGQAAIAKVHDVIARSPQSKDKVIEALEAEKLELARAFRERSEALQALMQQRRDVERTMGESLLAASRDLEDARSSAQLLSAKISELELDKARLADELASARRLSQQKDEARQILEGERDQLAKALLAEAEKMRALIDERSRSDEAWTARLNELQAKLTAETEAKTRESSAVSELKSQLATLSEHLARALKDRDASSGRGESWQQERDALIKRVEEKEQMITMLNGAFRKMLDKGV